MAQKRNSKKENIETPIGSETNLSKEGENSTLPSVSLSKEEKITSERDTVASKSNQSENKESKGSLDTFLNWVLPFRGKAKEDESKPSYMDVYKKQSTEKSVRGTQLILLYLASKGIEVDPEIIHTLTFTKGKIERNEKLTPEEEGNFWIAYTKISNQIEPVTVKSLKCIREEFGTYSGFFSKKKISYAERVQGFYRRTGIFVLLLVLITQILWLWQNFLLDKAWENLKQIKTTIHQIQEKEEGEISREFPNRQKVELFELEQNLKIQKKKVNESTDLALLKSNFINFISDIFFFNKEKRSIVVPSSSDGKTIIHSVFDSDYLSDIQSLTFWVQVLTLYILPLGYGMLGSCTYILRLISLEIERQIYVREHDIQFALRILLGTFAGFVIGWFISSDAEVTGSFSPSKLSPFALAFLAGYSVELLFNLLDKIVSLYSGTAKRKVEEDASVG
ncbi:MAG: hypothetical protein KDK54_12635 [Leptospiraceae bacterium]|nr:hypothetical protein [Leptospiraceae bacterium]